MNVAVAHTPVALATPHQRLYIRTLLRQLDLDVDYVTSLHTRFFKAAGIAVPDSGRRIDALLCALNKTQASALASALKAEVCDE